MWYHRRMISCLLMISLFFSVIYTDKVAVVSAKSNPKIKICLRIGRQTVSGKTISIKNGKRKTIKVTKPKKKKCKVTFRSNRPHIVSVSKTGKLTAKKAGTAKVTVTMKVNKKKYKNWVKIRVVSAAEKKDDDSLQTDSPTIILPSPTPLPAVLPPIPTPVLPSDTSAAQPSDTPTVLPSDTSTIEPSVTPEISPTPSAGADNSDMEDVLDMYNIEIHVNGKVFSAKLYQTETTDVFMQKLPLSITMNELNGNEKYYYFSENFPTESQKVSQIHAGDLKLYGSSCLVLFYESFSTSYSYTDLGYVENPEGLAEALGRGNAKVEIYQAG